MTLRLNDDDKFSAEAAIAAAREQHPGATRDELLVDLRTGWASAFGDELADITVDWLARDVEHERRTDASTMRETIDEALNECWDVDCNDCGLSAPAPCAAHLDWEDVIERATAAASTFVQAPSMPPLHLVYQGGIGNLFIGGKERRIRQSTFTACEDFAHGYLLAGGDVYVWHANVAGDVATFEWTPGCGGPFEREQTPPPAATTAERPL